MVRIKGGRIKGGIFRHRKRFSRRFAARFFSFWSTPSSDFLFFLFIFAGKCHNLVNFKLIFQNVVRYRCFVGEKLKTGRYFRFGGGVCGGGGAN